MSTSTGHPFLLAFVPEAWGEAQFFGYFWKGTYGSDRKVGHAVAGVLSQFQKAGLLLGIASRLLPGLDEDERELAQVGFTPAAGAAEVAAVVESAFCSLYSTVDNCVQALNAVYGHIGHTERAFKDAASGKLGRTVPPAVAAAFARARWFADLHVLRIQVTHLCHGTCHRTGRNQAVQYRNRRPSGGDAIVIDDVLARLTADHSLVNTFLGDVFHALNSTLVDQPVQMLCGFSDGACYERRVSPCEPRSSDSGQCLSWVWFDTGRGARCPRADVCGAYARRQEPPRD